MTVVTVCYGMLHVLLLFILLLRPGVSGRGLLQAGAGMGLLLAVNIACLVLYGMDVFTKAFLFTYSIPGFLLYYMVCAEKKTAGFFSFVMASSVCLWIMAATGLLDAVPYAGQVIPVSRLAAFPLAELLFWRFLRTPCRKLQEAVEPGWGLTVFAMLHYALLVAAMQYARAPERDKLPLCPLVLVLVPVSYAALFFLLYRQLLLARRLQGERVRREEERLMKVRLEHWRQVQALMQDRKRYKAMLYGLLAAGRQEQAAAYLQEARRELDTGAGRFCANKRLNVVFGYYAQRFQELGTQLRLDLRIGSEKLPELELCQICSNGLENAWEASCELAESAVSVKMKYSGEYLVIRIKNRCRKELFVEKGTIPRSTRRKGGHGFGLFSIRAAAEGLGGSMCCYTDRGNFVLEVSVRTAHEA